RWCPRPGGAPGTGGTARRPFPTGLGGETFMARVRVGVLGYGVIGKRVARALGYAAVPAAPDADGPLRELLAKIDVLLDCTPSGVPGKYQALYDAHPEL